VGQVVVVFLLILTIPFLSQTASLHASFIGMETPTLYFCSLCRHTQSLQQVASFNSVSLQLVAGQVVGVFLVILISPCSSQTASLHASLIGMLAPIL
jgi:hypothetical protein